MNRTYSTQAIRTAMVRAREEREIRRQDAEALAAFNKEREVTHKQVKGVGPVPRPPDVSTLDDLLDDWQDVLDQTLAVIDKAAARERTLSQSAADRSRFPSLGES